MQRQYQCLCFSASLSQSGIPTVRFSPSLSPILLSLRSFLLPSFNFTHSYTHSSSFFPTFLAFLCHFYLFFFRFPIPSHVRPPSLTPDFLQTTMTFALNEIHANEDLKFDNLSPFSGFPTIQRQSSGFAIPGFPRVIAPEKWALRLEEEKIWRLSPHTHKHVIAQQGQGHPARPRESLNQHYRSNPAYPWATHNSRQGPGQGHPPQQGLTKLTRRKGQLP